MMNMENEVWNEIRKIVIAAIVVLVLVKAAVSSGGDQVSTG